MNIKGIITLVSRDTRVGIALVFGFIIIFLTLYGGNTTTADILFAEMFHATSNTLVIALLFIAYPVFDIKLQVLLGKVSGTLLCGAGVVAFIKAYTTFVHIIITTDFVLKRGDILLFVSAITIVLTMCQMLLIWNERSIFRGYIEDTDKHLQSVHQAAKTGLLADSIWASFGLIEYLVMFSFPGAPLFVRFVDFALTLGLGWWMMRRGFTILIGKNGHYPHHDNHD